MAIRIRVRKTVDGTWWVSMPEFGFTRGKGFNNYGFDDHGSALRWATAQVDGRYNTGSISASVYTEAWSPWTLRTGRR